MARPSLQAASVWTFAVGVIALTFLGAGCSSSKDTPAPCCAPQPLLVPKASGGLMDVTGTAWSECRPDEPSAGMSRLKTMAFGAGTFTASEDVFVASVQCTGATDPALRISATAQATAQGNRQAGWDDGPPPGLATTVTTAAVLFHGFAPGSIPDLKDLLFVDDGASPDTLYTGDDTAAGVDGYPTMLRGSGKRLVTRSDLAANLQGTWASDCIVTGQTSVRHTRVWSGAHFSGTNLSFGNTTCSGTQANAVFSGTYTVGDAVSAQLGATTVTAHEVDVTWQLGGVMYTIVHVDTAPDPDVYYYGDHGGTLNGSTDALRPTSLVSTHPLHFTGAAPTSTEVSTLLQGTWAACEAGGSESIKTTFAVGGSGLDVTETIHPDPSCGGAGTPSGGDSATFSIGPAVATIRLDGVPVTGHQIDLTWSTGPAYHLIFLDSGAEPDVLWFGNDAGSLDGSTPALRPQVLGPASVLRE